MHLAPCKLSLGQGQGRVQPDLGSCNFPQPPAPAELTAFSSYFINIPKGVPSPARPAALQSLCPLRTAFTMSGRAVRWGGAGAARGIQTSGSIHVYTGMGPDRAEGLGRHLGEATRPQTEDASFRLVLSLHRCRIRSALGRGGTAGCGFAGWVAGCSSRGLPGLRGPGRA